jgi:hypothetical protein
VARELELVRGPLELVRGPADCAAVAGDQAESRWTAAEAAPGGDDQRPFRLEVGGRARRAEGIIPLPRNSVKTFMATEAISSKMTAHSIKDYMSGGITWCVAGLLRVAGFGRPIEAVFINCGFLQAPGRRLERSAGSPPAIG